MCAGSDGKLGELEVDVYMGYYGGRLTVGDVTYEQETAVPDKERAEYRGPTAREKMVSTLLQFTPGQLADLLCQLVENANE